MEKERLGAFVDAVIAIIITIMVLEMKAPHEPTLHALIEITPVFLSYVLSFVYLGIYWVNHHHFFQLAPRVNGAILWANIHLLFWLSLVPFATAWMGENHFAPVPMAVYGVSLVMPALAWYAMQTIMVREFGKGGEFDRAIGRDLKGKLSPLVYLVGVALAFVNPWLSGACYVAVALMWLVPDRRMEKAIAAKGQD
jgi:uncharacterized membrane protein